MSEVGVKRDVEFGLVSSVVLSFLLFAPLCHAVTISTSDAFITQPIYPDTSLVPSTLPVSDGSDGIFQPTQSVMLDLAPDAVFNFSLITIESAISVGFNRNGSNVPIYFLAMGDILIDGVLDGGMGPLYIATPGSITLNGDILGQDLTLSGSQIVISSSATITGTNIFLGSSDPTAIQPSEPVLLLPGSRLVLDWQRFIQVTPVPIPPSIGLFFTGLIPMWLAGRFRFRRLGRNGG